MSTLFINSFLNEVGAASVFGSPTNKSFFDAVGIGGVAYAGFESNANGRINQTFWSKAPADRDGWLATGDAIDFEVRVTLNSGSLQSTAPVGVWLSAGTSWNWFVKTTSGVRNASLTVEWRDVATLTVQGSIIVNLNAEVT